MWPKFVFSFPSLLYVDVGYGDKSLTTSFKDNAAVKRWMFAFQGDLLIHDDFVPSFTREGVNANNESERTSKNVHGNSNFFT